MHPTRDDVAIPAPRGAAEPTRAQVTDERRTTTHGRAGRDVGQVPGWLSLVEAVDEFAAGLVARFEHELTRAEDPAVAARLRRQAAHARALEAVTAPAADGARRPTAAPDPVDLTVATTPDRPGRP